MKHQSDPWWLRNFFFLQDLNRNFPSYYDKVELDRGRKGPEFLYKEREHETKLMMKWILQHPFTLSANFQDGAVLVQVLQ